MVTRRRLLKEAAAAAAFTLPLLRGSALAQFREARAAPSAQTYPRPPRDDTVDVLHGVRVADPYRPLEDLGDPAVRAWADAHDERARAYLESLPVRARASGLLRRFRPLARAEPSPVRAGGRTFTLFVPDDRERSVLYVAEGTSQRRTVLDPAVLAADGSIAIARFAPSPNGRLVACMLSEAGSDRQWVQIIDTDSSRDIGERLDWCRATTVVWLPDNSGFYYTRLPGESADPRDWDRVSHIVCRHMIGSQQAADVTVFGAMPHRALRLFLSAGANRTLLILGSLGTSEKSGLWTAPIEGAAPVAELVPIGEVGVRLIGSTGSGIYIITDLEAPTSRVVRIDPSLPARSAWKTIVPAGDHPIDQVVLIGDKLVVRTIDAVGHKVAIWGTDGHRFQDAAIPPLSRVEIRRDGTAAATAILLIDDYRTPRRVDRLKLETGASETTRAAPRWGGRDDVEVRQVFVASRDGTRVPMTLIHRRGLARDGLNRTLLFGYGGFGTPQLPAFNPFAMTWVMLGGIYAIAGIRGGGEYGQGWHDAGRIGNKQNSFDDFLAAAQWLVAEKYTRPARLGSYGASNGGLTVLATMLQRPDLFGAVVAGVPLADMLRFDRFTVGSFWYAEYGDPASEQSFRTLLSYSPLHNIKANTTLPPLLVLTADNDDRVPPLHAYKFVAALTDRLPDANVWLKTEMRSGHGGGNSTEMTDSRRADVIAFLCARLGGPILDPA